MSGTTGRLETASLTSLHWVAIVAALVSAAVHLVLGVGFLPHWMGVLFVLAAGGFVGAVVLVLVDFRRRLLYLVGVPFTGVQIVGWYQVNRPAGIGDVAGADAVDKIAQVVLIVALIVLYARES